MDSGARVKLCTGSTFGLTYHRICDILGETLIDVRELWRWQIQTWPSTTFCIRIHRSSRKEYAGTISNTTKDNQNLVVIMDRQANHISSIITAYIINKNIACIILHDRIIRNETPSNFLTDIGIYVTINFLAAFCIHRHSKPATTTAYHRQTYGHIEWHKKQFWNNSITILVLFNKIAKSLSSVYRMRTTQKYNGLPTPSRSFFIYDLALWAGSILGRSRHLFWLLLSNGASRTASTNASPQQRSTETGQHKTNHSIILI